MIVKENQCSDETSTDHLMLSNNDVLYSNISCEIIDDMTWQGNDELDNS